jgi:hypothetical protein
MLNPASYGDLWKGFLTTPYTPIPVAPLTLPTTGTPAPAGTTPYLFNPFDPATWTQVWPQATPPAAAPAPAPLK